MNAPINPSTRIRRAGPDFRWPNGARVAPGIGPMGNVLKPGFFDTNAHSWANYGAVRGIQRLHRIVDANKVRASVMVNGVLAEKYPQSVKALAESGHEIVAHSWGMDVIPVYLDEAGERENIRRNKAALKACGVNATGWISPRGTGSLISPRLLAEEGFAWYGDCNDDDLPSIIETGTGRIVGIPLTMDVNDLPHVIRYGNSPGSLVEQFKAVLANAKRADTAPFMLDVTAHTHVFGRPAGAWAYDAMIKLALAEKDIWIGTRDEIARHALANEKSFT